VSTNTTRQSWMLVIGLVILVAMTVEPAFAERTVKTKVSPAFPELAKRMNVNGVVKVELTVNPNGSVKSAKAIGGHPLLIEAAVSAAKQFKYEASTEETKELVEFKFSSGQ
jgi:TonB family protein